MISVEYKFRVTDGVTFAEEFTARDARSFSTRALRALDRSHGRMRGKRYKQMLLQCAAGDEWFSVRDSQSRKLLSIDAGYVFSNQQYLWESAWRSAYSAVSFDEQIGGMLAFIKMTDSEKAAYRMGKFTLIEGNDNA